MPTISAGSQFSTLVPVAMWLCSRKNRKLNPITHSAAYRSSPCVNSRWNGHAMFPQTGRLPNTRINSIREATFDFGRMSASLESPLLPQTRTQPVSFHHSTHQPTNDAAVFRQSNLALLVTTCSASTKSVLDPRARPLRRRPRWQRQNPFQAWLQHSTSASLSSLRTLAILTPAAWRDAS